MFRKSSKASNGNNEIVNSSTGLNFDQKWQIIQHFTEWIKHGDSKIQMLLTIEGVIIAGYGAMSSVLLSGFKSEDPIFASTYVGMNIIFTLLVLWTIWYGFFKALHPDTSKGKNDGESDNLFFYGTYKNEDLPNGLDEASSQNVSKFVNSQIAALGRIASGKYERVVCLQWLVFFSSALFFVIAIVGFLKGIM